MFKEHIGLAPTEVRENIFEPAPAAIALMQKAGSGYKKHDYNVTYDGAGKILVICTENNQLQMANGTYFLTGNHPVETFVPLLHLERAGFDFDIATPTGKPVQLEEWATPKADLALEGILERTKDRRAYPLALAQAVEKMKNGDYLAVFVPGGHGAIIGLPDDVNVKIALTYFMAKNLHVLSLCHGPAAFLAAAEGIPAADYPFREYTIAAFPDAVDQHLPKVGYLPGPMPWYFNARLEALGVTIVKSLGTGKTHVDRKVITGDGPLAADKLGRLAAEALLREVGRHA